MTEAAIQKFPDRTMHVRNHARALEQAGKSEEAVTWYQRAVWCPDVDDTTAIWFGNELHNRGRHTDAIEAYCLACVLDPDDATGFTHVADEIAWALKPGRRPVALGGTAEAGRALPEDIGVPTMYEAAAAALSCRRITEEAVERLNRAFKRLQVKPVDIGERQSTLDDRVNLAFKWYEQFRTELTAPSDMHDGHGTSS